jgi:hypothetical protein
MSARITGYIRQHHLALVALFFALTGTAYAVDGPLAGTNQVGSEDIIDAEVKQQDVANNAIGTGKIPDGAIRSADVANDTTDFGLIAEDLEAGSVGTSEVAEGSLTGTDISNKTLTGEDVAFNSLFGAVVADESLTGADVDNSSLTGADVQNSSLSGSDIAPGALTGSDIADDSLGGEEIDESDLALPFRAIDDGPDAGECEGVLSAGKEPCADIDSLTVLPPATTRIFIAASGGWSKELGDPADSECDIFVSGPQSAIEAELFMGDNSGFGGGHSSRSAAMPFTLNATTDFLQAGTYRIELGCADNSSGDQDTFIHDAHISALALPAEGP